MAPIKFEENMREKLEKRTIQPSSSSWEKLSDRLDKEDNNQNNRNFWWLGIAASVVLLIFSGFLFFNKEPQELQPEIVNTQIKEEKEDNRNINSIEQENILESNSKERIVENKSNKEEQNNAKVNLKAKDEIKKLIQQKAKPLLRKGSTTENLALNTVAENKAESKKNNIESIEEIKPNVSFETQKLNEVLAEIKILNSDGIVVSDKEIDSLLKIANKEIFTNRILDSSSRTVDADALLQDVEADIEQSFRARVFDAIKNGYDSVKTAVAERNN